jgi:MFS family permease
MDIASQSSGASLRERYFLHNFIVNVMDGAFFGFALGFASFITIIPLFISTLTDSALLIGLIPAIHIVGWQLPQIFTAQKVSKLRYIKPMVIFMTIQERLPFLGLALVAWFVPHLGPTVAIWLGFGLLIWQGIGGGLTANAWQSMIGKIVPEKSRGLFFGVQSAAANLLASLSAVIAGVILERRDSPLDFTLCFLFAGISMMFSLVFLAWTREWDGMPRNNIYQGSAFWKSLIPLLRGNPNFRWFLVVRIFSQFATMAFAFYTVYAVRHYGMSEGTAGVMTGVLMAVQIAANPLMGWLGDRWSHRSVMGIGLLASALSAIIAWRAPAIGWFYLVFILAGIANVGVWTLAITMTLDFGSPEEMPTYIGLANTLVAPSAMLAPLFGGWLADQQGYQSTFLASALGGLLTAIVVFFLLKDTRQVSAP